MSRRWTIGTRYHANDTYHEMIERGSVVVRKYPATHNGKEQNDKENPGTPVFLPKSILDEKRRDMGPYVYGAQMLQNPTADKAQGFSEEWLKFWRADRWSGLNRYILVDPASKRGATNDYSVFWVIGLGSDRNYYAIDVVRDRLNLTGRAKTLFDLHRIYRPLAVGYEEYGMQADIEHIQYVQEEKNYRFDITPLGGQMPKPNRIRRLVPIYEQGRFYLPESCIKIDYEQRAVNLVKTFIDSEFSPFPVCAHDDMLDCQARILDEDLKAEWPADEFRDERPEWQKKMLAQRNSNNGGFMSK